MASREAPVHLLLTDSLTLSLTQVSPQNSAH